MDMALDIGGAVACLVFTFLLMGLGSPIAGFLAVACIAMAIWFIFSAIADAAGRIAGRA